MNSCANGQVLVKNTSGAYVCTTIDCSGLTPISAFNGFLPNGSASCAPITTVKSCPADNYTEEILTDGTIKCGSAQITGITCPAGQQLRQIDNNGNAVCWPFVNLPINCPAGQALKSIDANGNWTCATVHKPLRCNTASTVHSDIDCTSQSGSVEQAGTAGAHCKFNAASCPPGWNRCALYGSQTDNSCTDTTMTYYCAPRTLIAYAPSGNWVYSNSGQSAVQCVHWSSTPNSGHACYANWWYGVTYSTQQQVGCY